MQLILCLFKKKSKLWDAYKHILKDRLPLLNLDMNIITLYAQYQADYRKKENIKPVFDLLIACTTMVHNLILATCNYKDFKNIEGLKIEDWRVPYV